MRGAFILVQPARSFFDLVGFLNELKDAEISLPADRKVQYAR